MRFVVFVCAWSECILLTHCPLTYSLTHSLTHSSDPFFYCCAGKERNSYYHPRFLRGLPHLAKTMKRPGVNEKTTLHPSKQPDLYKISKRLPLLLGGDSDSDSDSDQFNNMRRGVDESTLLLKCALEGGGPKTRMPIYTALSLMQQPHCIIMSPLTPKDESCLNNFGKSILASEAMFAYGQRRPGRASPPLVQDNLLSWTTNLPKSSPLLSSSYVGDHNKNGSGRSGISATANATHWTRNNTLLFPTTITNTSSSCNTSATSTATHNGIHIRSLSSVLAVANELALLDRRQQQQQQQHPASSAFAAGFAAATAFSQQHFHDVLDQLSRQQQNGK